MEKCKKNKFKWYFQCDTSLLKFVIGFGCCVVIGKINGWVVAVFVVVIFCAVDVVDGSVVEAICEDDLQIIDSQVITKT